MTTRERAKRWLRNSHPAETASPLRTSKYFSNPGIWYFTFPVRFFHDDMQGYLNMLCETPTGQNQFHFLKVPFSFFRENRDEFDIRRSGDNFDLRISARANNWLIDERGNNVSFIQFKQ